jgi:predicted peroxiredoxin
MIELRKTGRNVTIFVINKAVCKKLMKKNKKENNVEDENKLKSLKKKKVWRGVRNLLCKLGIHNFPKNDSYHTYGDFVYLGKLCKNCEKEK